MFIKYSKTNLFFSLIIFFIVKHVAADFGGMAIAKELYDYIRKVLPEKKTILEFGSGWGSGQLAKHYTMYSVEHDKKWINKFPLNYIYAPISNGWYNVNILQKALPKNYDLILVDGPPAPGNVDKNIRVGFYKNIHLFDTNVIIILDDVDRTPEYEMCMLLVKILNHKLAIYSTNGGKKFAVFTPR